MDLILIHTLWILFASALVFFMQAGFAMVEIGFTRAKNAGNILMKNFVVFCLSSIVFYVCGYSFMFGSDVDGFIGFSAIDFAGIGNNAVSPYAHLIFQTMLAAIPATIVSGSMSGRTKFGSYMLLSFVLIVLIYPVSGHWIWGNGWLAEIGFYDFAGSTVIHSVGGWAGLMSAIVLGPRIGKYVGGKTQAIPGHNMIYGGLGVFILWLGWFGFNTGWAVIGADNSGIAARIFVTTNLAASAGALATLFLSWYKYGKPDLTMTLNGALAGLVAISAGCAVVSPLGAIAIGALAGILVLFSIEFVDRVLQIDDPVGASSVHGLVGAFGTVMVGLFGNTPQVQGLFYGGGTHQLVVQLVGVVSVAAWVLGITYIVCRIMKATIGLRVSKKTEIEGLDIHEHGQTAYDY